MSNRARRRWTRIGELMRELRTMPEKAILDRLRGLRVSQYIYGRNHEQIAEFVSFIQNDPSNQDLWHMTSIEKGRALRFELARLLQNYVASVKSLVDHTRRIYKDLYRDGSFPDYQQRIDELFVRDPLVQFVQGLRNVLLHAETAPLVFHGRMGDEGDATNELGLSSSALAKHEEYFNSTARRYLRAAEDVVDIPTLLREYNRKVVDFYSWFNTRQREIHAEEIARYASTERLFFLLRIRHELETWFANPDPRRNAAAGDRGLFLGLFDKAEFDVLEKLPAGSGERANTAIMMLSRYYPVPRNLERDIRRAYENPEFFEWRTFVDEMERTAAGRTSERDESQE